MQLPRKPLPNIDDASLFPPNVGYDYFYFAARCPFEHNAAHPNEPSLVNAWWLAEASLLAHTDLAFASNRFTRAGLTEFRTFGHDECFIAHNDDFAIVTFRGSDPRNRNDIARELLATFDSKLIAAESGGHVHAQAHARLDAIWHGNHGVAAHLATLAQQQPARTVWLTGHGIGGAMAVIAAQRLDHNPPATAVYTFGAPRCADAEFIARYATPTFRFVQGNDFATHAVPDIVQRLRKQPIALHVGQLQHIDRHGVLRNSLSTTDRVLHGISNVIALQQRLLKNTTDPLYRVATITRGVLLELPWDGLVDHAPVLYATRLWNAYVDKLRAPEPTQASTPRRFDRFVSP